MEKPGKVFKDSKMVIIFFLPNLKRFDLFYLPYHLPLNSFRLAVNPV